MEVQDYRHGFSRKILFVSRGGEKDRNRALLPEVERVRGRGGPQERHIPIGNQTAGSGPQMYENVVTSLLPYRLSNTEKNQHIHTNSQEKMLQIISCH